MKNAYLISKDGIIDNVIVVDDDGAFFRDNEEYCSQFYVEVVDRDHLEDVEVPMDAGDSGERPVASQEPLPGGPCPGWVVFSVEPDPKDRAPAEDKASTAAAIKYSALRAYLRIKMAILG